MSLHLKCHPFQQYFWKSCPNFGGSMSNNFFRCHVQQNLWGGVMSNNSLVVAISGISFQQHPFWGRGISTFKHVDFFPKRMVPQAPDHPKNHSHKKSSTFGEGIQPMVTWGGSPTLITMHHQVHRSPGTMSEQNLLRFQEPPKG